MGNESNGESLRVLQKPFTASADLKVETSGVLPDYFEEIHKVLRVELIPQITKKERLISEKTLICEISGTARFGLTYEGTPSADAPGQIFFSEFEQEFTHRFEWPFSDDQAPETFALFVNARTLGAVCKPFGAKKPSFSGSIRLDCELIQNTFLPYVSDPGEDAEVIRKDAEYLVLEGAAEENYELEQTITLEDPAPPIRTILSLGLDLAPDWVKASADQAAFGAKGMLNCSYLALDEQTGEEIVKSFSQMIELSEVIGLPSCKQDSLVRCELTCGSCHGELQADERGEKRVLRVLLSYSVSAAAFASERAALISDLYFCLKAGKSEFSDFSLFGSVRTEPVHTETQLTVLLPEGIGDPEGIEARIDTIRLDPEAGAITAAIAWKIGYFGMRKTVSRPVYLEESAQSELKFRADLPAEIAKEDLHVSITGGITETDAICTPDGITLQLKLSFELCVWHTKTLCALRAIEWTDQPRDDFSGVRFYYPEPQETLWEIGKRFGIGQAELQKQNGIGPSDPVPDPIMIAR